MNTELFVPDKNARKGFTHWSVVVLTPHADYECATGFTKSLVNLMAYSWMHGLKIEMIAHTERMVVDWARNDLARLVRDSKSPYSGKRYTHALWLDDDMVFGPDLAVYLASELGDYDMMSALYFGRHKPFPVVYVRHDTPEDDKYRHYPLMKVPARTFPCDAAGFGAMLMKVDILDDIPEPWFTIDARGGEDIVFCVHAREHGKTIGCAGAYRLGHISKPRVVTEEDHLQFIKDSPEIMENFTRVDL